MSINIIDTILNLIYNKISTRFLQYTMEKTMSLFSGATLMITGGTGSFGKTVLKHLLEKDIKQIRIFSRDEKSKMI